MKFFVKSQMHEDKTWTKDVHGYNEFYFKQIEQLPTVVSGPGHVYCRYFIKDLANLLSSLSVQQKPDMQFIRLVTEIISFIVQFEDDEIFSVGFMG